MSLRALLEQVVRHQAAFAAAISADFGHRATVETELGEILMVVNGIKHARRNLGRWMRPQHRSVAWQFRPGNARVLHQPLGVIGIIAPWNYPVQLSLAPLTAAIAAGNRVMLKPSELTPRTAELLHRMLGEIFPEDQIAVIHGGPEVAQAFGRLPLDHLLFTGSGAVGREVMCAAAERLTPVTLELGGKSPVIVCPDYPVRNASRLIAMGKLFNAGQTCIAPDYALVPADTLDRFVEAISTEIRALYPAIPDNPDYTSIVSDRHHSRLAALVDDAAAKGARIVTLGSGGNRKFPPTLVLDATPEMAVMREEIFGPILPILPYASLDAAIALINGGDRPLALYCFSHDHGTVDQVLARTLSGGVTVNGTLLHCAQEELPFGGVGGSGFGAYHGRAGFERFSHARAVYQPGRLNPIETLRPPYGRLARLIVRALIGK
jgi:coniferyl-aldehyde dehydrogenase